MSLLEAFLPGNTVVIGGMDGFPGIGAVNVKDSSSIAVYGFVNTTRVVEGSISLASDTLITINTSNIATAMDETQRETK